MRRRIYQVLIVLVFWGVLLTNGCMNMVVEQPNYVLATHYFANEWPLNFWNAEWDTLDNDLQQIKKDGFNTVIIVVPWREFQPEMNPIRYNENAITKLGEFLETADRNKIHVQIRLGYLNDFYGETNSAERFYDVLADDDTRAAWFDYAETIYKVCSKYSYFSGGFITWEDFWHNYVLIDYVGGTPEGLAFSMKDGFPQYLTDKYTLEEFNQLYASEYNDFCEVGVPERSQGYAEEWFSFIDEFTMNLFADTRDYFPELFMEVRTDDDPVANKQGEYGVSHQQTWSCGECEFTTIMYKPTQGVPYQGEQICAEEAVDYLRKWLDNIYQNNSQKKIYIDQFLFVDNTPGYTGGHLIKDDEVNLYLTRCTDVLRKYTNGYGVWVYRDYCNNMLYNSQFSLGLEGWDTTGEIKETKKNGSAVLEISSGAEIRQSIPEWHKTAALDDNNYYFEMDYVADERGIITVSVGTQTQSVEVGGSGKIQLIFEEETDMSLKIKADTKIIIDNLKLYNFVQSQELYNVENQELSAVAGIRELNKELAE